MINKNKKGVSVLVGILIMLGILTTIVVLGFYLKDMDQVGLTGEVVNVGITDDEIQVGQVMSTGDIKTYTKHVESQKIVELKTLHGCAELQYENGLYPGKEIICKKKDCEITESNTNCKIVFDKIIVD